MEFKHRFLTIIECMNQTIISRWCIFQTCINNGKDILIIMVNTNIYNLFTIRKIIPYVHMWECEHVLSVYSEYTIELTEIIFLLFLNEKLLGITALFRVRCLKLYQVQLYMYVCT